MGLRDRIARRLLGTPQVSPLASGAAASAPLPGPPPAILRNTPRADGGFMPRVSFANLLQQRRYDSIVNALTGLGTPGDKGQAGVVDMQRPVMQYAELTQLYRNNGYVERFVKLIPDECTRKGWRINDGGEEHNPMKGEDARLNIVQSINRCMRWARLYGGATILLVTNDDVPPEFRNRPAEWLRQPLDLERVISLDNLIVLDPTESRPLTWEGAWRSPRFRDPLTWTVQPRTLGVTEDRYGNTDPMSTQYAVVHSSRLIYMPGNELPPPYRYANGGFDDSVIQPIWDAVRTRTSLDQALAVISQQFNVNVLKIENLEAQNASEEADAFMARMTALVQGLSLLQTVILKEGETFETTSMNLSSFSDLDKLSRSTLSAVTGLPEAVLFGQAPSGLNTDGESHQALMANLVSAIQTTRLNTPLRSIYEVVYAAQDGPWGGEAPDPSEWNIEFCPIEEMSESDAANMRKVIAETDAIYITAQVVTADHVAESRFGEDGYSVEMLPVSAQEIADQQAERASALAAEQEAALAAAQSPSDKVGNPAPAAGANPAGNTARGDGEFVLPPTHEPAMVVPRAGASCATCSYLAIKADGPHCTNADFATWRGESRLPVNDPATYCSDWYEPSVASVAK